MGYQTYPEYRDPGVQWLGKVPAHWGDRRLKYVASCNDDVLNEDSDPDRLIRYVDIGNVSEGRIQGAEEFSFHNAPFRARRLVKDGDIIVSTVRTYLRAIAVIHNPPEEMVVSTGFAVIRPRNIDGNFLAQALKSNAFVDWVVAESKGISYPAINASELMGLSIALPPSEEQTTIAAFLDEKTTQIDQLIEKKTRFIELLKEKRTALITGVVTGKFDVRTGRPYAEYKDSGVEWLGEVPRHWRVQRIASLYRESNESGIHELPVLQISIHHGASDTELTNETSDRKITRIEDRSKYKRVRPNDLAYNMMRAWQGGFGAISVEGLVSPAYVVATPITTISSRFVELLLGHHKLLS